ncbi:MAG: PIG-L family deacetylase [Chloroflexi bacterium]|nr:PIG-L family deacetylase [Chloroflexota bacterium]
MAERPNRALVVIPHPDDAEVGCGGTVAKWTKEGTEVFFVLCTNGDKGTSDPEMTSEKLAVIREKEQLDAATVLGVKEVVLLRHPDGELEDNREFRGEVVRAIRRFKPDAVMCPDPLRRFLPGHRDHRICGQVALDAVFPYARDYLHFAEHFQKESLEPHKVGEVYLWGTEEPDTFIDITDTIEAKVESLRKHASQMLAPGRTGNFGDFVRANAQRIGLRANYKYAEAFRRIQMRR